jgi:predicted alpha/beta superfamily hydrolase
MKYQKKQICIIAILMVIFSITQSQVPSSGTIKREANFASKYVTARNIDIWLPDGYSTNKKYAVLYMHDGQMLYDSATTWNKKSWDVDDAAAKLMAEGKTRSFIIVGIWNGDQTRHRDYFPQKPFESLTNEQKASVSKDLKVAGRTKDDFQPISDNYLKFLVLELKPFIDKNYSTKKDRNNTFIAGSSMGGLISMYAICEYPEIFGGAACLSTHWPGSFTLTNNPIPNAFLNYLQNKIPSPKHHKLYFDHGTKTLDALYAETQLKANEIIIAKGYTNKNFLSKVFEGDDHSEGSWAKRVHIPLEFLLH